MGARAAGDRPAFIVASGPAAGVVGAARLSDRVEAPGLIAFDMGGTTAKASLVEDGRVSLTTEYEFREGISTSSRFIKAGGYLLKVPAIDIAEVGAGAGSIGWIDAGGLLRVGPESAGATPGPACYGLGGVRPTVTDANVVLGLLNPVALAGGELPLDTGRARDAIRRHVAEPLGLDLREAAHGIREVANATMARAIRAVTIERGRDPRELTLVAFGGSGPVHACDVAGALEIRRVLVPVLPGVFTAVGMLASDVEHHLVRSARGTLDALPVSALDAALDELTAEALAGLAAEGYPGDRVRLDCQVDLRYVGQASELAVPVPGGRFAAVRPADLHAAFTRQYRATYGHSTGEDVEVVNLRVVAAGLRSRPIDPAGPGADGADPSGPRGQGGTAWAASGRPGHGAPRAATTRAVAFRRGAPALPTPVVDRDAVTAGGTDGPLIIETYDSTVVVPPEARVRWDPAGNLLIDLPGSP
jgi:N-methylhydantoinase A